MAATNLGESPEEPRAGELKSAHMILGYAYQTANSFLKAYSERTAKRGRGAPSFTDQDLLRAMVVFAGAGLDATVKQVIGDALQRVLGVSDTAQDNLAKFVARRVLRTTSDLEQREVREPLLLARMLVAPSPREALIQELISDLRGRSLQSVDELDKARAYLGIASAKASKGLSEALRVRHVIVHEMDVDMAHKIWKRRACSRGPMISHAKALLKAAADVLREVDVVLSSASSSQG